MRGSLGSDGSSVLGSHLGLNLTLLEEPTFSVGVEEGQREVVSVVLREL